MQEMGDDSCPTAFITWAHGSRGWPAGRDDEWHRAVIEFACLLDRYVQIDADFFHFADAGIDWSRYGTQAIKRADTVLIVGSDAYWASWEGLNQPDEGAGSTREIDALHGLFDRDRRAFQTKVAIVLLPGVDDRSVPDGLSRVNRYPIPTIDAAGIEALLRRLLGIPEYTKRPRKLTPDLPTYNFDD